MTELGNCLREARDAKGLTIEDIQEITKIQKRYLLAIEKGNYDIIPGKFYVRAFIKQYAEAVGLEPDMLFEEYRHEIPKVYEDDLPEQLSRAQARKHVSKGPSKFMEILPKILVTVYYRCACFGMVFIQSDGERCFEPVDEQTNIDGEVDFEESENRQPQIRKIQLMKQKKIRFRMMKKRKSRWKNPK